MIWAAPDFHLTGSTAPAAVAAKIVCPGNGFRVAHGSADHESVLMQWSLVWAGGPPPRSSHTAVVVAGFGQLCTSTAFCTTLFI